MDIKITFQGMPQSDPIEAHIREKIVKIEEFRGNDPDPQPFFVEFWLKANKEHVHHRAEIHLKTPRFSLDTHHEDPDMYWAIDHAIDRMVNMLKKEKEKARDKERKIDTDKKDFANDQFTLSDSSDD